MDYPRRNSRCRRTSSDQAEEQMKRLSAADTETEDLQFRCNYNGQGDQNGA